ncbi:MAG: M2 family metallopeptidase [Bryobacteraceae bacterium]|nr:M2 family metallopeptidase [Bryobacteraceae bacterium]
MGSPASPSARNFLDMYNEVDRGLYTVAAEANWKAATDVSEQHTGERIGADSALAAFRGSRYVIENSRRYLDEYKESLTDIEFRELDKILLNAAESPGTIPDIVQKRVAAEARLGAILDGFTFCLERRGETCVKAITPNEIDQALLQSRDLAQRKKIWEVSKQTGPALKKGLAELRDLRNQVARQLGYSSYFHLQVADYGMTVAEMMTLMEKAVRDAQPLYDQLHLYARRALAKRYSQPVPDKIPAHWLGNRWGQEWPGLVDAVDLDPLLRSRPPEWIVKQAERFYASLGMPALPESFWSKSDLYQLPPDVKRRKNTHASAWHIDHDKDVRSLMSVVSNYRWFETAHHELGHVYYYMAYSNSDVPHVLREGANRAFHEALGDLIAIAARQELYLREVGIWPKDKELDRDQYLLSEALDNALVFLPWSAGVMTHFEYELYEKELPASQFNRKWWELVEQYQGIVPPAPRGEEHCDACTKTHIIDDAAQYYDYAIAYLIKYQLHDHAARKILRQDPRNCNYYGNEAVGDWLWSIMRPGATRDWRVLLKEKTGEEISSRAMLDYFRPLHDLLRAENATN